MRISDANVGDVLRDKDGNVWFREGRYAVPAVTHRKVVGSRFVWKLSEADMMCGPFTRLVPEKESDDAK